MSDSPISPQLLRRGLWLLTGMGTLAFGLGLLLLGFAVRQALQGIYDGQDGAWRQGLVGAWLLLAAFLVMRRVRKLRREGALKP